MENQVTPGADEQVEETGAPVQAQPPVEETTPEVQA